MRWWEEQEMQQMWEFEKGRQDARFEALHREQSSQQYGFAMPDICQQRVQRYLDQSLLYHEGRQRGFEETMFLRTLKDQD